MSVLQWIYLIIAGGAGGFLSGLLGVGGGIIFVPIISIYIGYLFPETANFTGLVMGNSFAVILVVGILGTLRQRKSGHFYPDLILITGISAVIASILTSKFFVVSGFYSRTAFVYFFILLLLVILVRFVIETFKKKNQNSDYEPKFEPERKKFILPGIISGLVAALSGMGGGIILIPYFTQILKVPIRTASSLSLSVITIGAVPLVIFYIFMDGTVVSSNIYHTGYVIWELIIPLLIGAGTMVGLGVKTSKTAKPSLLFALMSILIIITIAKMWYDL